jgi:uncharacterized protein (DUF1778 family)
VLVQPAELYCKRRYNKLSPQSKEITMPSQAQKKGHPLSIRLPDADIAMIDRAARLRGRSRTDFMRDAAVRLAEDIVMENALVRMSPQGFDAFMAKLDAPAQLVPEMAALAKRKSPWDKEQR